LLNTVGAQEEVLAESSVGQSYSQALGARSSLPSHLQVYVEPDENVEQVYLEWLART
jgi:hypothetical protein